MGPRVAITVYDGRWKRDGDQIVWKTPDQGNVRRQQVVTIQSRQYLRLPPEVQERLFTPGAYSEMWPEGPDSIEDLGPRNIRIAYIEDQLLAIANEKRDQIQLIPERFDAAAAQDEIAERHVLAICEGSRSRTLEHFADKFGACDPSMYALDGKQVQDLVLGLRVKSELTGPDGRPADRGPEPLPAELPARRGLPEHAADRPGGAGSGRDRPSPAGVHRVHPVRALPAGAEGQPASSSALGITPCSCRPCSKDPPSGRGCRKDCSCSASRRRT